MNNYHKLKNNKLLLHHQITQKQKNHNKEWWRKDIQLDRNLRENNQNNMIIYKIDKNKLKDCLLKDKIVQKDYLN